MRISDWSSDVCSSDLQTFEHPQVQHRQMKLEMEHPLAGRVELVANPIRYENNPIQYHNPPPLLGQHTDEILSDLLGIGEEQLKSMRESGIDRKSTRLNSSH